MHTRIFRDWLYILPGLSRRSLLTRLVLLQALASGAEAHEVRVMLDRKGWDARYPGRGDFLDCPTAGPCEAVVLPRVEPDEKVALPRNKPREDLSFLTLKAFRAQGGDPVTTAALYHAGTGGDSLYVDFNNDEDLGNDGPGRFWSAKDSCITAEGGVRRAATVSLCRPGSARARQEWQNRCETLKGSIMWAACGEGPYRLRVHDMALGSFRTGKGVRAIGVCDLDGDGRYRLAAGDRLLLDWNGDGLVEKSLDGDGFSAPAEGPFIFSLDGETWEVAAVEEDGSALTLRRQAEYASSAEVFKPVEGRPAPDLRFVNLDSDTVRISDFRGKKILLQFWSALCAPCLDQLGELRRFNGQFKDKNWMILSITTDKELDLVQQASLKHRMDWMVGMAGPEARGYFQDRPLPIVFKIDSEGILEKKDVPLGKRAF